MSASKSTYRQDMPPKGGFAPVIKLPDTKRKGFSNIALLGLATGLITYGIAKYLYYQKQEKSHHTRTHTPHAATGHEGGAASACSHASPRSALCRCC